MTGVECVRLSMVDRLKYAPTREQWQDSDFIQHGSHRRRLFFAAFGIMSARWQRITKENKLSDS